MKVSHTSRWAVLVAAVLPAATQATTLTGNFSGYADHSGGTPGVYVPGESYVAYMDLDPVQESPWYPWDSNLEYTAVLQATVLSYVGGGMFESVAFTDATVEIYADSTTPADYADPATFTDGTLILSGTVQDMVGQRYNATGVPWGITGTVLLTGGVGLGDVHPQCGNELIMNDFINFQFGSPPAGYEESYDALWNCPSPVSVEGSTWGRVKSLYH